MKNEYRLKYHLISKEGLFVLPVNPFHINSMLHISSFCIFKRVSFSLQFLLFGLFLLIAPQIHLSAQSLDKYLLEAAENNPNLKSKFFQYQAALERVPQVGSLPDPQLSFGFFLMPMERYMGNQIAEASLIQMFPWFGTLGAAKDEMTFRAKAQYESFNEAKSILFYEVRANWYALQLLESEIAITKEDMELLKTMEQIAMTRFKSGGSSMTNASQSNNTPSTNDMSSNGNMIDVLRVQMEINQLQNNLNLLEDNKIPLQARFNQLLNRNLNESVSVVDSIVVASLPVPLNEIADSIKNNNPMLKMLEQEEEAFIAQGKMNKKVGLPMIGIGVQYGIFSPRENSESSMNGQNMLMPMATVTIPLWRKKYSSSVKESDFMHKSIIEQKKDASNQLQVNYEDVLKDYKDAERRVELFQKQTALANQALNILIAQYSTQGSNFEEVLRMQQQLLNYRLKYLDAKIDKNMAVAMVQRLMGR